MVKKQHLEHLQLINQYWQDVFSNLLLLNKTDSDELVDDISPYIVQLATLPISKKSVFRDMLWDFDEDTSNRVVTPTWRCCVKMVAF
nr:hypothetical protein [Vibrio anguillarum]